MSVPGSGAPARGPVPELSGRSAGCWAPGENWTWARRAGPALRWARIRAAVTRWRDAVRQAGAGSDPSRAAFVRVTIALSDGIGAEQGVSAAAEGAGSALAGIAAGPAILLLLGAVAAGAGIGVRLRSAMADQPSARVGPGVSLATAVVMVSSADAGPVLDRRVRFQPRAGPRRRRVLVRMCTRRSAYPSGLNRGAEGADGRTTRGTAASAVRLPAAAELTDQSIRAGDVLGRDTERLYGRLAELTTWNQRRAGWLLADTHDRHVLTHATP